jgi:hypothetical protein
MHTNRGSSGIAWGGRNSRKRSSQSSQQQQSVVNTEVIAAKALAKNALAFRYPKFGFVTKIEYSLLYSMINRPDIYPAAVIKDAIRAEDFTEYLLVHPDPASKQPSEDICSYAQLSALLALASEKWPPPVEGQEQQQKQSMSSDSATTTTTNGVVATSDVARTLCKVLLQCVIRHAEEHNLDREAEIDELFQPFHRVTNDKVNRSAVAAILPAYVGMGASILAGGNPIPFYIGYAVSINAIANQERELANFKQIATTTNRMANVETADLLNDCDHDD